MNSLKSVARKSVDSDTMTGIRSLQDALKIGNTAFNLLL